MSKQPTTDDIYDFIKKRKSELIAKYDMLEKHPLYQFKYGEQGARVIVWTWNEWKSATEAQKVELRQRCEVMAGQTFDDVKAVEVDHAIKLCEVWSELLAVIHSSEVQRLIHDHYYNNRGNISNNTPLYKKIEAYFRRLKDIIKYEIGIRESDYKSDSEGTIKKLKQHQETQSALEDLAKYVISVRNPCQYVLDEHFLLTRYCRVKPGDDMTFDSFNKRYLDENEKIDLIHWSPDTFPKHLSIEDVTDPKRLKDIVMKRERYVDCQKLRLLCDPLDNSFLEKMYCSYDRGRVATASRCYLAALLAKAGISKRPGLNPYSKQ